MHDQAVSQEGVFERAIEAVKLAKSKGFRVTTNSTFFYNTDPARVGCLFGPTDLDRSRRDDCVAGLCL